MLRISVKLLAIFSIINLMGCSDVQVPELQQSEHSPGGSMTVKRLKTLSYIHPGSSVTPMQKLNFWSGFSFFRDPWVISPSSTKSRDGLGPLFNTRSCISCHDAGSRGPLSPEGESLPSSLVIKFGKLSTKIADKSLSLVDPNYGDQLQPRSILYKHPTLQDTMQGEASLQLSYQTTKGRYADGSEYELRKPSYHLTNLAYGEMASHIGLTPRFAPNIFGAGLLDAIDNKDLLAQEDISDSNDDGISAKYNRVPNVKTGVLEIGRFGLKANHPNLAQQIGAAFRNDIGITNSFFPTEACTEIQRNCIKTAKLTTAKDSLEINDKLFSLVLTFNRLLGVPPARDLNGELQRKGREHFYLLGCQQCHQPSYQTDKNYPVTELANQRIWPYSDLALHDMGEGLADNVIDHKASGQEWRTAPLWGIGLQSTTTRRTEFLHDGRARSISEAILWHGGEAAPAQQKFIQLTRLERKELITFLQSI
jgi:CxxC motif-containing protein (DUF1111 family)